MIKKVYIKTKKNVFGLTLNISFRFFKWKVSRRAFEDEKILSDKLDKILETDDLL